jgi:hypothetical protein
MNIVYDMYYVRMSNLRRTLAIMCFFMLVGKAKNRYTFRHE